MGNERVIFSNRFDRPTLEQIEEEMKNKNYDDNENLMSADEFLEFMKQNRRTVPNEKRIANKDKFIWAVRELSCQTAHCGRGKSHFIFGGLASPIVPYRNLTQTTDGITADCRSLV